MKKKVEILKSIKTKDLETKMKNKEERIRARKDRIRRRIQAKKKLDEKAKRVTKKCSKKSKANKKSAALPVPVTAEPLSQPELEEVVFQTPDSEVEVTPVEVVVVSFDDFSVSEPEEQSNETDVVDFVEVDEPQPESEEKSWDLYRSFTDTVNSAVSGVTNALNPTAEDHRIQGIAFRQKLDALEGMGFTDKNRNILLLVKNLASLESTVSELVETS